MDLTKASMSFGELLWSCGDLTCVIEVNKDRTDWKTVEVVIDFVFFV